MVVFVGDFGVDVFVCCLVVCCGGFGDVVLVVVGWCVFCIVLVGVGVCYVFVG